MRQRLEAGVESENGETWKKNWLFGPWRSSAAARAGLSVSELNAEMPTEMATVSANWL